jgi:hypothetical protein
MNPSDSSPKSSARWRRFVRPAVYAVIILALCPFVYTRLATPPPQRVDPETYLAERYKPPPDQDVTELLKAAMASFPPEPYPMDFTLALHGEWTPETRVALQDIIHYLELPETRSAFAELRKHLHGSIADPGRSSYSIYQQAARLLVADARFQVQQNNDPQAAIEDLVSAYRLARVLYNSRPMISLLVAMSCESLANTEIIHLARYPAITPAMLRLLGERLDTVSMPSLAVWKNGLEYDYELVRILIDNGYTDDGRGGGWLYLAEMPKMPDYINQPTVLHRSRLWNLLSPVFSSRKTVEAKREQFHSLCRDAVGLPLNQAREHLIAAEGMARAWTPADGPLFSLVFPCERLYCILVRGTTLRNAAKAVLAIEEFRKTTGRLPDGIAELVPTYLRAMAEDLCDGKPLRYKCTPDLPSYVIYSVGNDGIDQGGPTRLDATWWDDPDVALIVPRSTSPDTTTYKRVFQVRPADPWKDYDPNRTEFPGTRPAGNVK